MTKFEPIAYKISIPVTSSKDFEDVKNDVFTWGFEEDWLSYDLRTKLNKGIKLMGAPWKHSIPLYRNDYFVFRNKNSIEYFLFGLCKMTKEDLVKLHNYGYSLYKLNIGSICCGLSEMRGSINNDDLIGYEEVDYNTLDEDYKAVEIFYVDSNSAKYSKQNYYTNFKFKL